MPDNEVLLKLVTQAEQASAAFDGFISRSLAGLDKLASENPEIHLQIAQAKTRIDQIAAGLKSINAAASAPSEVRLEAAKAKQILGQINAEIEKVKNATRGIDLGVPFEEALKPIDLAKQKLDALGLSDAPEELQRQAIEIADSFDQAGSAVARFEERAKNSAGRGAKQAFAQAAAAVEELESRITRLRNAGVNVAPLEARLASLKAGIDRGNESVGKIRKGLADASDAFKVSTLRAGEFEGQIGSIEGILNTVNPRFGELASKILALQGGIAIIQSLGTELAQGVKETALSIGATKEQSEQLSQAIQTAFSINPIKIFAAGIKEANLELSGGFETLIKFLERYRDRAEEIKNLRNVLELEGIDTANLSLEQLIATFEDLRSQGRLLAQEEQTAQARAREFAESVGGTTAAVEDRSRAIIEGIEIYRREGDVTASSAAAIVSAIDAEIEALARLGRTRPELEELRKEFERLAASLKLQEGIKELGEFTAAISVGGKITREQADKIVGESKRIISAIRELPLEERKDFAERAKDLQGYIATFTKFTSEYAAEQKKQAEAAIATAKAEKQAYLERAAEFQKLLGILNQRPAETKGQKVIDAEELRRQVDEARAELSKLEGPQAASSPFLSPEDLNRAEELRSKISDLEVQISRLGDVGAQAAGGISQITNELSQERIQQINDSIAGLTAQFASSFQGLNPIFQQTFNELISRFQSDLNNGLVGSEGEVERFSGQITSLLQDSGLVVEKFGTNLGTASQGVLTLAENVKQVKPAFDATAEAVKATSIEVDEAASSYIRISRASEESTKAAGAATTGVAKLKEEFIEVTGESLRAHGNMIKFEGKAYEIKPAAEAAAEGVGKLKEASEGTAKSVGDVSDSVGKIAENAAKASEPLKSDGTHLIAIGDAGAKVKPAAENMEKLAIEGGKAAKSLDDAAREAKEALPNLDSLKTRAHDIAIEFTALNAALKTTKSTLHDVLGEAKDVVQALKELSEAQKSVQDSAPN